MRARHLRKKKNVGDADPAAAPAPLRTAAPVTTEQPTRRRSAVAALGYDAETGVGRLASPPCMMEHDWLRVRGRSLSSAYPPVASADRAEPAEGRGPRRGLPRARARVAASSRGASVGAAFAPPSGNYRDPKAGPGSLDTHTVQADGDARAGRGERLAAS